MHSSFNLFANHAPVWVFVLLGFIVGAIALVLYFATAVGGGDKDYLYGDPSRQHYLQYPSYGPFGGFTNF
ncbi:MAG TPA: hypothetical protein VFM77_08605 [Terriglobales bacterium]|nr:hypothetical protein [Terriglobales bacterium]